MEISGINSAYDGLADAGVDNLARREERVSVKRSSGPDNDTQTGQRTDSPHNDPVEQSRSFNDSVMNQVYTGKGSLVDFMT